MISKTEAFLFLMFLLMGICISGIFFSIREVPKIDFEPNISIKYQKESDPFFRVINQNANARPYEIDIYDCTEFAKNVAHDLNELGWEAEDIHVVADCESGLFEKTSCEKYDGGHRIVRVDKIYVEAVSGHIIAPWDYKAYGIN